MGEFRHLWLIPVVTFIMNIIGIVVPYAIGAADGNIQPILPFISDGGAYPPEKGIFSLFQNISAVLLIITGLVKQMQFLTYYECRRLDTFWRPLSYVTLFFGMLCAVAFCVVGNFSEMDELDVHNYAALVTFFSAILYMWFTSGLSFLRPYLCSPPVAFLRIGLALLATAALVFHECTLQFNIFVPAGTNGTENSSGPGYVPEWLTPDSPFYTNHIVATATEWLLAFTIFAFFLTFIEEFRKASLTLPSINFHNEHSPSSFRVQPAEESWKL